MLIGEVTRRTGVSRDTIRYYERLGLVQLASRGRRGNNYKEYAEDTADRLTSIAQLKAPGCTLADIKELFPLLERSADPCAELPERIGQKMRATDERIRMLEGYRTRLAGVLRDCRPGCCTVTIGLPSCIPTSA